VNWAVQIKGYELIDVHHYIVTGSISDVRALIDEYACDGDMVKVSNTNGHREVTLHNVKRLTAKRNTIFVHIHGETTPNAVDGVKFIQWTGKDTTTIFTKYYGFNGE
jgi:hypothetical protein